MEKHQFKITDKEVADEIIARNKNFKKLKANYEEALKPLYKKPLYKNPKTFVVILIICLLAYIISEYTGTKPQNIDRKNRSNSTSGPQKN